MAKLMSEAGDRNSKVQIVRAVAIVAVVMIHTTPWGLWQVCFRPLINFSVATFLFLSGYLTKAESVWSKDFYVRRITRVLIPYVLWTLLLTLCNEGPGRILHNLLTAQASAPFYYIFVYVQFVLLTPFMLRLARSRWRAAGWLVAPCAVIAFKYVGLLTGSTPGARLSLACSLSCLGWFSFYYLGLMLGNHLAAVRGSQRQLLVAYGLSVVLQVAEGYAWLALGEWNCGTQLKLTSLLTSSLFILMTCRWLEDGRFQASNRLLRLIGDYSFGIYLSHYQILRVLSSSFLWFSETPYPLNSLAVLLLSLCCCVAGDRILGSRLGRLIGLR